MTVQNVFPRRDVGNAVTRIIFSYDIVLIWPEEVDSFFLSFLFLHCV